jgi:hypothetical protein
MKKICALIAFSLFAQFLFAQDLDALLDEIAGDANPEYVHGTFKGTMIINGESVETAGHRDLNFTIMHRFGELNLGLYDLFGLDLATTRFGFDYGVTPNLSLILGRSSWEKTYDGAVKYRFLRQQRGANAMPITATIYSGAFLSTLRWEDPERENLFSSRLTYSTQLMIARKFSPGLSLQLTPSYVHKNLVPTPEDQNNIFATGLSGRFKLTPRLSLNAEYFYLFPGKTAEDYENSFSLGFDIQTGGHVFQLHFTNSRAMFATGYIAETTGRWLEGDIAFGFNILRVFPTGERRGNIY